MKKNEKFTVPIIFVWIGFVGAISFMEAWLKFQAPSVTREIGLEVGCLVFSALNKVEIVLALLILGGFILNCFKNQDLKISYWIGGVFLILLLDTFWLLPALEIRAKAIINEISVPNSSLHLIYVCLEVLKVTALFVYGIKLLKTRSKSNH